MMRLVIAPEILEILLSLLFDPSSLLHRPRDPGDVAGNTTKQGHTWHLGLQREYYSKSRTFGNPRAFLRAISDKGQP